MSAGIPGKLQRALTCCSSLIKGSKRTFNFKGLFLKDSAYCKVAPLKNKTIFAGPDFAVSWSPAISGTAEICTSATDRKPAFMYQGRRSNFHYSFFICIFFPFSNSFPLVSWKNLKLLLFKLKIPHFRDLDAQYCTSWACIISVYLSASSVYLCCSGLRWLVLSCSFINCFSSMRKSESLSKVDFNGLIYFCRKLRKIFGNYCNVSIK